MDYDGPIGYDQGGNPYVRSNNAADKLADQNEELKAERDKLITGLRKIRRWLREGEIDKISMYFEKKGDALLARDAQRQRLAKAVREMFKGHTL
jgi:hypothetical protein